MKNPPEYYFTKKKGGLYKMAAEKIKRINY